MLIITGSIETYTAAGEGVAAGGGGRAAPPAPLEAMPVLVAAQMTSAAASCCGPAAGCGGGAGPTQDAAAPGAGQWAQYREVRYPSEKETRLGETQTPLFLQGLVLGPHKSRGGKFAHK